MAMLKDVAKTGGQLITATFGSGLQKYSFCLVYPRVHSTLTMCVGLWTLVALDCSVSFSDSSINLNNSNLLSSINCLSLIVTETKLVRGLLRNPLTSTGGGGDKQKKLKKSFGKI